METSLKNGDKFTNIIECWNCGIKSEVIMEHDDRPHCSICDTPTTQVVNLMIREKEGQLCYCMNCLFELLGRLLIAREEAITSGYIKNDRPRLLPTIKKEE